MSNSSEHSDNLSGPSENSTVSGDQGKQRGDKAGYLYLGIFQGCIQ